MVATMAIFMLDDVWHVFWFVSAIAGVLVLGGPQVRGLLTFRYLRDRKPKQMELARKEGLEDNGLEPCPQDSV